MMAYARHERVGSTCQTHVGDAMLPSQPYRLVLQSFHFDRRERFPRWAARHWPRCLHSVISTEGRNLVPLSPRFLAALGMTKKCHFAHTPPCHFDHTPPCHFDRREKSCSTVSKIPRCARNDEEVSFRPHPPLSFRPHSLVISTTLPLVISTEGRNLVPLTPRFLATLEMTGCARNDR